MAKFLVTYDIGTSSGYELFEDEDAAQGYLDMILDRAYEFEKDTGEETQVLATYVEDDVDG